MKRFLIAIALIFVLPAGAFAASAEIAGLVVEHSPELRVSFAVKNAFTSNIEEAVNSGVPTAFTFKVILSRNKGLLWFDETVVKKEFKHTVKYDTLKEEYEVTLGETGGLPIRTRDLSEMKRLMTTGEAITLKPAGPLVEGAKYEIRIKAELKSVRLPFRLDYVLFFVRLFDFETRWHTYRFTF
jgi:hypothetical protein